MYYQLLSSNESIIHCHIFTQYIYIYIYMNNIDVTDLPYCLAAAWNSNEACFEGFDPEHRVSSHLFNHS